MWEWISQSVTSHVSDWLVVLLLLGGSYPVVSSFWLLFTLNKSNKKNGKPKLRLFSLLWALSRVKFDKQEMHTLR